MSRVAARVACLGLLGLSGCRTSDGVLGRVGGGSIDGGSAGGSGVGACVSPTVTLRGHETCTSRLAANKLTNALCSCGDVQMAYDLTTHGFDSTQAPYQAGQPGDSGASVGINGRYLPSTGSTNVGGSFSIAGSGALSLTGLLAVRGDFYAAGDIAATGLVTVARNAWLGGSFSALGAFTVKGALHHAGSVSALPVLAASNTQQAVSVAKPCSCEPSELVDIAALVAGGKSNNDNDRWGIARDALASVAGSTQLSLPCGRFYLSQIAGMGNVVVQVNGLAAVFVDGPVSLIGNLSFQIAPGAEVDVFVGQDFAVQGLVAVGSKERPASGRLWIAGSQAITLLSPWIGNLYAPRARVSATVGLEAWGSIFAGEFMGGLFANFVFDRSVMAAEANCTAPTPPAGVCSQCEGCAGEAACVAGKCGLCQKDSDCCSLSVCSNGSCVPWIEPGTAS
jgi:hypothetical protein